MRVAAIVAAIGFFLVVAGCSSSSNQPRIRTPDEQALFGPATMRLHPTFTQVKDWTNDGKPDGVEAVLEFDDQFGDPTKAAGTAVFELYAYRRGYPDPRGERLVNPWLGSIISVDEQRSHWHKEIGAYSFLLTYDGIRSDRDYVLTVSFEPLTGPRLSSDLVLTATKRKSGSHGDKHDAAAAAADHPGPTEEDTSGVPATHTPEPGPPARVPQP
jgi:hypothetical protein